MTTKIQDLSVADASFVDQALSQILRNQGGLISLPDLSMSASLAALPSGSGVAGQLAYWNGTKALTGTVGFTFDGANLAVPGNIVSTAGTLSIGGSQAISFNSGSVTLTIPDSLTVGGALTSHGFSASATDIFMSGYVVQGAPVSAIGDGFLSPSTISFYLDEAGNNLKVRVRYSNGTYKTGTIALV